MGDSTDVETVIDQLTGCGIPKSDISWKIMFKTMSKLENYKKFINLILGGKRNDMKENGALFAKRILKTDNFMRVISHFVDLTSPIVKLQQFPSPSGSLVSYINAMRDDEVYELILGCTHMLAVLFKVVSYFKLNKLLSYISLPSVSVASGDGVSSENTSRVVSPSSHCSCLSNIKSRACSIYEFIEGVLALLQDARISENPFLASICSDILTETFLSLHNQGLSEAILGDKGFSEFDKFNDNNLNEGEDEVQLLVKMELTRDRIKYLIHDIFRYASSKKILDLLMNEQEEPDSSQNKTALKLSDLAHVQPIKKVKKISTTGKPKSSLKDSFSKVTNIVNKITSIRKSGILKAEKEDSVNIFPHVDKEKNGRRLFPNDVKTMNLFPDDHKKELKKTKTMIKCASIIHSFLKLCCVLGYIYDEDMTKYLSVFPNLILFNKFKCKSLKKSPHKTMNKAQNVLVSEEVLLKHKVIRMLKQESYFLQLFFYYMIIRSIRTSENQSIYYDNVSKEQKICREEDINNDNLGTEEEEELVLPNPLKKKNVEEEVKENIQNQSVDIENGNCVEEFKTNGLKKLSINIEDNVNKIDNGEVIADVNDILEKDGEFDGEWLIQFLIIEISRLVSKLTKSKYIDNDKTDMFFINKFFQLETIGSVNKPCYSNETELFILNVLFEISQSNKIMKTSLFQSYKNTVQRTNLKETQEINYKDLLTSRDSYIFGLNSSTSFGTTGIVILVSSVIAVLTINIIRNWFKDMECFVKNNREWENYIKSLNSVELNALLLALSSLVNSTSDVLTVGNNTSIWLLTLPIYVYTVLKGDKLLIYGRSIKSKEIGISVIQKSRILNIACDVTSNFISNNIKLLSQNIQKKLHEILPVETYSSIISYSFVGETDKENSLIPSLSLLKLSDSLQKYYIAEAAQKCLGENEMLSINELLSYIPSCSNLETSSDVVVHISRYMMEVINDPNSYNGVRISSIFMPIYESSLKFTRLTGFCSASYIINVISSLV